MGKLSLKIIEKYNLPQRHERPDYDDAGIQFELPSGIEIGGLFMCNGAPCKMDALEGLDGFIYIQTEEELVELINLSYDELITKVAAENEEFNPEDY